MSKRTGIRKVVVGAAVAGAIAFVSMTGGVAQADGGEYAQWRDNFGATAASPTTESDSEWRYVPVRRFFTASVPSTSDSDQNAVAMETLTIAHEGLDID